MTSVAITRKELGVAELRAVAARTANAKQARRILAVAMVLDGHPRLLAAQAGGMDRQTLRDWVHRYNADGVAGLADRPRPGRQPRLSEVQRREVAQWVENCSASIWMEAWRRAGGPFWRSRRDDDCWAATRMQAVFS